MVVQVHAAAAAADQKLLDDLLTKVTVAGTALANDLVAARLDGRKLQEETENFTSKRWNLCPLIPQ